MCCLSRSRKDHLSSHRGRRQPQVRWAPRQAPADTAPTPTPRLHPKSGGYPGGRSVAQSARVLGPHENFYARLAVPLATSRKQGVALSGPCRAAGGYAVHSRPYAYFVDHPDTILTLGEIPQPRISFDFYVDTSRRPSSPQHRSVLDLRGRVVRPVSTQH